MLKSDYWSGRIKQLRAQKQASKESERQKALETHFKAKGMAVPEHLKAPQTGGTLDYGKIKEEAQAKLKPVQSPAVKQIAPTNKQGDKLFHPDISGKVNYNAPKKLAASEPAPDHSKHCQVLKRMIGTLKKVDPTTHLQGVLVSKSGKK
jgi:hypothetical protein